MEVREGGSRERERETGRGGGDMEVREGGSRERETGRGEGERQGTGGGMEGGGRHDVFLFKTVKVTQTDFN